MLPVFLQVLSSKREQGFTLLELLVVTIIVGILAVISIPSFLRQTGKAREAEFQKVLGNVNRAQQGYHFEFQKFAQKATDQETLQVLGISFDSKYIDSYNIVGNSTKATTAFENNEFAQDGTRAYSGGTFYDGLGGFSVIICRSFNPSVSISPPTDSTTCPDVDSERLF